MSSTDQPPPIVLRRYRGGDEIELAAVFYESVRHVARRDYTTEQVAVWAPIRPEPSAVRARCSDGRTVIVAVDAANRRILGYGDLEANGHLDHLYCRPEGQGRGVGAAIVEEIEREARRCGIGQIHVEASEAARKLLLTRGFVEVHRNDFDVDGVRIHNFAMVKSLG